MRLTARMLLLVCLALPLGVEAREMNNKYNAWVGAMIGQHFTGELNSPALFPMAEFRTLDDLTDIAGKRVLVRWGRTSPFVSTWAWPSRRSPVPTGRVSRARA